MSLSYNIHSATAARFFAPSALPEVDWEEGAKELLDAGHLFLAYDLAQAAFEQFPESVALKQIMARVLMKTGALDEARVMLEELCPKSTTDYPILLHLYKELRQVLIVVATEATENEPTTKALETLGRMLKELGQAVGAHPRRSEPDSETLGLLGSVNKDLWRRSGEVRYLLQARDIYLRDFLNSHDIWTGINAASMSWVLGEHAYAADLAAQVRDVCRTPEVQKSADPYYLPATIGEADLLLGREAEAIQAYREAMQAIGQRQSPRVSSLQQLKLLQEYGCSVPGALFEILKPPTVVVFVGHMLDAPDRPTPRFPAYLEATVRAEIDRQLDALDAQIGYCSAACGSDLLFIEAMLDRGGQVNILLPFALEDFLRVSVEFAGPRWVNRFHRALQLAHSVKYITEEPLMGDHLLFDFLGKMLQGYAIRHAAGLQTEPYMLTVWDGVDNRLIGGTADLISRWHNQERFRNIPLRDLLAQVPVPPVSQKPALIKKVPAPNAEPDRGEDAGQRCIRTMLFADIVGYSKLQEQSLPHFMYRFLKRIAEKMEHPEFVNTWGDAIFVVMDSALPMVEYALKLQEIICNTDWKEFGLLEQMSIRIALHAGPVFETIDPITGRPNFYGAHVNRAARMEPITIPGHVYASEQFVGLLTLEQMAAHNESAEPSRIVCEYLGPLTLAKNFGSQVAYHLYQMYQTTTRSA